MIHRHQTPLYRVENVQVQELSNVQEKQKWSLETYSKPIPLPAGTSERNTESVGLDKDFHWEAKGKS